jgi:tRNA-dihydrouridine synthase B
MTCFKIKNISIKNKGVLAPMQEYTHLPFRLLCKKYSAGLLFTEMVSTRHVLEFKDDLFSLDLLTSSLDDTPTAVQLFGDFKDKKNTLESIHLLDKYNSFDIIDLNLGCPSLKIINSKSGSYNLKQIDAILPIIKEAVETTKKPITIKTRLGFNKNEIEKISSNLIKTGISALSIHGRLACENYSVNSRIDIVRKIKNNYQIPIIYNGDVSFENLESFSDFDGVMVGRAALGNPFIFKQIDSFYKKGVALEKQNNFSELSLFLEFVKKHPISFSKLKVSLIPFFKGKEGSSKIRDEIAKSKNLDEIIKILDKLKVQSKQSTK